MNKPILTIKEGEEILLPKEFHRINNICAVIYDQLTEIYNDYNYKELLHTDIKFDSSAKFINEIKEDNIDVLNWLKHNELNEEIELVLTKQIILALTADFLSFMFEALYSAKRGKMTVAYALLRKPLTDELLIFEQLLGNRKDFINRFFHLGNPENFDPSDKKVDKKKIIEEAINKLRVKIFPSSEFMYDLRYKKEFNAGINGISNHALHIVTRDRNYKTSNQNFNFIFSQEDDIKKYYEHFYLLVPYLLIYSVSVIDEIIFSLLPDEDNQNLKTVKEFRRIVGLLLLMKSENKTKQFEKKLFKKLLSDVKIDCPKCGIENILENTDYELFFDTEMLLCTSCFENMLSSKKVIKIIEKEILGLDG